MMTLSDNFIELLAYGAQLRRTLGEKQLPYEEVRSKVIDLIKRGESWLTENPSSHPAYEQARYAVCAWLDELILSSAWSQKNQWRPELLQRVYYHSTDAGEKFFDRLRQLGAHENQVREIFYLCLSLGFKGKYCGPDEDAVLRELKDRELKFLLAGQPGTSVAAFEKSRLFPEAFSKEEPARNARFWNLKRRSTLAFIAGAPVVVLGLLFLAYHLTLNGFADGLLKGAR